MTNKELRKRLYTAAMAQIKLKKAMAALEEEIDNDMVYEIKGIIKGCAVIDGCFYDSRGKRLARGRLVDDKYFCDQYTGYLEDNYHGYMYYPIDDNGTVVAVYYEC